MCLRAARSAHGVAFEPRAGALSQSRCGFVPVRERVHGALAVAARAVRRMERRGQHVPPQPFSARLSSARRRVGGARPATAAAGGALGRGDRVRGHGGARCNRGRRRGWHGRGRACGRDGDAHAGDRRGPLDGAERAGISFAAGALVRRHGARARARTFARLDRRRRGVRALRGRGAGCSRRAVDVFTSGTVRHTPARRGSRCAAGARDARRLALLGRSFPPIRIPAGRVEQFRRCLAH